MGLKKLSFRAEPKLFKKLSFDGEPEELHH
jgi:hypothetical protein